jgi:ABC-type spermidine/putrescine transport system permease subunit I
VSRGVIAQDDWPFGAAEAFMPTTATLVLSAAANPLVQRRCTAKGVRTA